MQRLIQRICHHVGRYLVRHGLLERDVESNYLISLPSAIDRAPEHPPNAAAPKMVNLIALALHVQT
jgi:hypothetical protein